MKNTQYSHLVAEKSVDRTKYMEPVQLGKTIQQGTELWKAIDQKNRNLHINREWHYVKP